jgi:mannan endo-1,6-alpha-mannosidase
MAPFIHDTVMTVLRTSTQGAVNSCNPDGICGFVWNTGSYDGDTGAGQQMNALGALVSLLVDEELVSGPFTSSTGGTSQGNSAAGSDSSVIPPPTPVESRDRAGAGVLTAVVLIGMVSMMLWMTSGENEVAAGKDEKAAAKSSVTA